MADTTIGFSFFGSTAGAVGSFSVTISNIDALITNVTGGPIDIGGPLAVNSFGPHSITFTGTTAGDFNGIGGVFGTFEVAATPVNPVPEPGTLSLLGLGAAALYRKRRSAQGVKSTL